MEQPPGLGCLHLLLLLLCRLPGARPAAAPASSGLRLPPPGPRIPSDRHDYPAWLQKWFMTEVPFDNTVKPWLTDKQQLVVPASQLDPHALPRSRLKIQHRTSSSSCQASWTAFHRIKRYAAARLHRAQLMRIGCVLGTCQVQNLSHRLWQLKGQSRRPDSSPMNPNSPYSYG